MIAVPYRRLTGFWDNGMRWAKPEDKLRKYDCTSHFEQATGWSKYKLSGDQWDKYLFSHIMVRDVISLRK